MHRFNECLHAIVPECPSRCRHGFRGVLADAGMLNAKGQTTSGRTNQRLGTKGWSDLKVTTLPASIPGNNEIAQTADP